MLRVKVMHRHYCYRFDRASAHLQYRAEAKREDAEWWIGIEEFREGWNAVSSPHNGTPEASVSGFFWKCIKVEISAFNFGAFWLLLPHL